MVDLLDPTRVKLRGVKSGVKDLGGVVDPIANIKSNP
jgi:hypothetical protein